MNFISKQCLYQSLLLDACMPQHNIDGKFSCLANIYALSDEDKVKLEKVLHNGTFTALLSADAVILHQNYLSSFCTDEDEFGRTQSEWEALEIKLRAYSIFKQLYSDTIDFNKNIVTAAEKCDSTTVTLALLYLLNGVSNDTVIPLLRRAAAHGSAEATILLMSLEPDRKDALYEKLTYNRELLLCNDNTLEVLKRHYSIEKGGKLI